MKQYLNIDDKQDSISSIFRFLSIPQLSDASVAS